MEPMERPTGNLRLMPNLMDSAGFETLDEIFMKAMSLIQDLFKVRSKLTKNLQIGYHLLAKARYVMGNKRVGSAQLPGPGEVITATKTVVSHLPADSDCYYFDLCTSNSLESLVATESKKTEPIFRGDKSRIMEEKEADNDAEEETSVPRNPDPLSWFGVLVPQELRRAQTAFKRATELSVEVANIQMKIEHTSQQFWTAVNNAACTAHEG